MSKKRWRKKKRRNSRKIKKYTRKYKRVRSRKHKRRSKRGFPPLKGICCAGPGCPDEAHCIHVLGDSDRNIKAKKWRKSPNCQPYHTTRFCKWKKRLWKKGYNYSKKCCRRQHKLMK